MVWVSDGEELKEKFKIYGGIGRTDIDEEIERRLGFTRDVYYDMYTWKFTGKLEKVERTFKTLDRKEVDLKEYVVWNPKEEEWHIPTNLRVWINGFFVDKTWEDLPSVIEEINRISREMDGYVFREPVVDVTQMEKFKDLFVIEHPQHTERNCWCKGCREMPEIVDVEYKVFETILSREELETIIGDCPLAICYRLRWVE